MYTAINIVYSVGENTVNTAIEIVYSVRECKDTVYTVTQNTAYIIREDTVWYRYYVSSYRNCVYS